MAKAPRSFDDAAECVEATLARVGPRIVLAMPLGIGKPNPLANEFYRRARRDPAIKLKICTALSLRTPQWRGELERRYWEPLVARVFGDGVPLDYLRDIHAGEVPDNIEISEFFLSSGAQLAAAHSQRHHTSTNYTHVARDYLAQGVNVIAQIVAKRGGGAAAEYSMGSNPDIVVDLLEQLAPLRALGRELVVIGEVNRQMPFMLGPAAVAAETFDFLLEHPRYEYDLFGAPNPSLATVDYAIGLYAASLVRDGGTLQVGIGELADAIVYGLELRHRQNDEFREILRVLEAPTRFAGLVNAIGGDAPFEHGLYACTEMFASGFLELYRSGVLRRRVYADARVQTLINESRIGEAVDERMLAALPAGGFEMPLTRADFEVLRKLGVFREECRYSNGRIELVGGGGASGGGASGAGFATTARLDDAELRRELLASHTGRRLEGGILLHGAFFLGPRGFYAALRDLPESERRQFSMGGVSFTNEVHGHDPALKVAQRQHGRFFNTTMMVTLLGAAVSDGLADGRVVSGVGGQYNFVAMAHALPGARSILAVRSTRAHDGIVGSNIRFSYAHVTIPRHLRDIVVTEYGIADLRGRSDQDVVAALLDVADSRFQDSLLREAKAAGKLAADYRIPDQHRNNTPQALEQRFALSRARGLFSEFPFGTDLTREEIALGKALARIKRNANRSFPKLRDLVGATFDFGIPPALAPHLERMQLSAPASAEERRWQRLLVRELKAVLRS
ncbi:MAG TPA: acetyl-CoA hydrolase/transferase C-terminal domain-containing protein [Steroidobacteraceae bacterium]|nr:acetyl-CoA hydrolase/transferase C-terminal domain-containing protein [Steroidobacteraceae bacterium]